MCQTWQVHLARPVGRESCRDVRTARKPARAWAWAADNARMPPEMDLPADAFTAPQDSPDATDPFEVLVVAALDSLPEAFRERLGSVAIVVEDEPTPDQLASVGAPGLLGLYIGVPRTAYGAEDAAVASKIAIFRGPHLRQYRDPEALARGVTETVHHEVAHHFGISDARLVELERQRRRG
jgi:predicted Zn-dependent protease with MMP-like domain